MPSARPRKNGASSQRLAVSSAPASSPDCRSACSWCPTQLRMRSPVYGMRLSHAARRAKPARIRIDHSAETWLRSTALIASRCAALRMASARPGSSTPRASTMPPTHKASRARARSRPSCSLKVRLEHVHHLLGHLAIGGLHRLAAAGRVGSGGEQRTAAFAVVEMIAREVGVDDSPCARFARRRARPAWPARHRAPSCT